MTPRFHVLCPAPTESNSGYHAASLASELTPLGFQMSIEFSDLGDGPTIKRLQASGVAFGLTGGAVETSPDICMLWNPRSPVFNRWQDFSPKIRVVHWEDNEYLLARARSVNELEACQETSRIHRTTRSADVLTYLNEGVFSTMGEAAPSVRFRIRPGISSLSTGQGPRQEETHGSQKRLLLYAGNVTEFVAEGLLRIAVALDSRELHGLGLSLMVTGRDYTGLLSGRPHVVLGNFLPQSAVHGLMKQALANVQVAGPPAFEKCRFPSKLPEYFLAGRPLLSEEVYFGAALSPGVDYISVQKNSPTHWITAIRNLVSTEDRELREMADRMRRAAAADLSWKHSADGFADLLRQLLK